MHKHFDQQRFSDAGLAALHEVIADPAGERWREMISALPKGVEQGLLMSCGLACCAKSGVHIDDVHFDARAAFDQFSCLPKEAIAPFFTAKGMAAYKAELLRLKKASDKFAKEMGLPDQKEKVEVEDLSLHWLGIKAFGLRDKNPAEAAEVYALARDRAKREGDDSDFFECERILALAQCTMTNAVVQQLERIAQGRLHPARNDIGLHFARATWALSLHLHRTGSHAEFLAAWQAALDHDLAKRRQTGWLGLRHSDARLEALIAELKRANHDAATLAAIFISTGRAPSQNSALAGLWANLRRLLGL